MNVTVGKALKYSLLPGIVPRIRDFMSSGFTRVAFFIAYVYAAVGILPRHHPYLNPVNVGRYGLRHVLGEARRALVFKKENIDQIIIYFTVLAGVALLFMQFAMLLLALVTSTAQASMGDFFAGFFVVEDPTYDIAFILLERTFGIPGIFGSCIDQGVPCRYNPIDGSASGAITTIPSQFHIGLHGLFHFYNVGVLAIGVILLLYFSVVVVAEGAQDGTPFGKRFNHAWAPVRLMLAIFMLTPWTTGLSSIQILTLYGAKYGSNMATNGWGTFLDALTDESTPMGRPEELVALPHVPPLNTLAEFMFIASVCKMAEDRLQGRNIDAYLVGDDGAWWFLTTPTYQEVFDDFLPRAGTRDVIIRFGERSSEHYSQETGHVSPYCGELILPVKVARPVGGGGGGMHNSVAANIMVNAYFELIKVLWEEGTTPGTMIYERVEALVRRNLPVDNESAFVNPMPDRQFTEDLNLLISCLFKRVDACDRVNDLNTTIRQRVQIGGSQNAGGLIYTAQELEIDMVDWKKDYLPLGWGGAGILYNQIAEQNGAFVAATMGVPNARLYPAVMERVKTQRQQKEGTINAHERYNPYLPQGELLELDGAEDHALAFAYYHAQHIWQGAYHAPAGNPYLDTIAAIFGLQGLFNMRENIDIHPMAQLSAVGRGLIESAIMNLGFSFATGVVGGIASVLQLNLVETVGKAASSFTSQIAFIGMTLGFVLFYIIPMLPFIYFFFAVGGWAKGIFEAMVGLPLWALAHVRIDGEGIPGPAAMNGYFLLLEIFLRPILILFGLIGGVVIFAAQVHVLNTIWDIVTTNLAGTDGAIAQGLDAPAPGPGGEAPLLTGTTEYVRGFLDQFFFTIIYTITVYIMGMASFKLIDLIPNYILRWIGTSVTTVGEQAGDPAGQLVQYAFMGGQTITSQGRGALMGLIGRNG